MPIASQPAIHIHLVFINSLCPMPSPLLYPAGSIFQTYDC
jgi:hypothetical protein